MLTKEVPVESSSSRLGWPPQHLFLTNVYTLLCHHSFLTTSHDLYCRQTPTARTTELTLLAQPSHTHIDTHSLYSHSELCVSLITVGKVRANYQLLCLQKTECGSCFVPLPHFESCNPKHHLIKKASKETGRNLCIAHLSVAY